LEGIPNDWMLLPHPVISRYSHQLHFLQNQPMSCLEFHFLREGGCFEKPIKNIGILPQIKHTLYKALVPSYQNISLIKHFVIKYIFHSCRLRHL